MNYELPQSYDAAMEELQRLVAQLQDPDCKVDRICDLTQRATQLLKYCRERLTKVDTQLAQLLKELDNE
jgi:exodeoxyribonuclease VII small subunit